MSDNLLVALISLAGALLAGNGITIYMIKRRDKVSRLSKLNNRQGSQITMLNMALIATLDGLESLVDALHDKGVLNGNAQAVKDKLKTAKATIDEYARNVCREQIMMKEDK